MSKFSELLHKFIKSDMNGVDDQPSPQDPEDSGMEETGEDVDIYTRLSEALTSGEVEPNYDSIVSWGLSNGLAQEEAEELAGAALAGSESASGESYGDDPSLFDEPSGESYEDDEEEMAKSTIAFLKELKDSNRNLKGLVEKATKEISSVKTENTFLKSEIEKLKGQPIDIKKPITGVESIPTDKSRQEVIEVIRKGILGKKLSIEDLYSFETKGKITTNVKNFMEKEGKIA